MFGVVLLLNIVGTCLAAGSTCSCSPFEYEEKLLAKMIRQEFIFEKLKDDILTLKSEVIDELKNINNGREEFKMKVNENMLTMQTQVNDKLTEMDNERKAFKTEISEGRKTLGNEFKNIMDNYMQTKEFQTRKDTFGIGTGRVAFAARDVSDLTLTGDQTFIFTTTVLNEGEGYDSGTGKFTAPTGGVYKFNIQFCINKGDSTYVYLAIMVNNKKVQGGIYTDEDNNRCYTADTLVRLESGEKVWVQCDPVGCNGSMLQTYYEWNTFSGYRVHA